MDHAHCKDTLLKKVPSPDGKLVIAIYNRSCSRGSGLYTYAEVENPVAWSWPNHAEVCSLVTLSSGYHQLDAVWKDDKHIEVSSTDELESLGGSDLADGLSISSIHRTCNDIAVKYNFRFRPFASRPAQTVQPIFDLRTALDISRILDRTEGCITEKFGPEHAKYLRAEFNADRHRHALGLLCTDLRARKCAISNDTYALFEQVAPKMNIELSCLKNLKPLVQQ